MCSFQAIDNTGTDIKFMGVVKFLLFMIYVHNKRRKLMYK